MPYSLIDAIKRIQDSQPAEIKLQLLDGECVQLKCVYKESIAPHFFLVFPPKQIPVNIDPNTDCLVVVKNGPASVSFKAEVEAIKGDRVLELLAEQTVEPTRLRTFYRADLRTAIKASYEPGLEEKTKAWNLSGETLDLSGGGTLTIFPEEFQNQQGILLHIDLPYTAAEITCTAHVIRTKKLPKKRWQVALQFDNLTQKERDLIVSICLKEQRRKLRDNAFAV